MHRLFSVVADDALQLKIKNDSDYLLRNSRSKKDVDVPVHSIQHVHDKVKP